MSNPFNDPPRLDDNPFSDPSISAAQASTHTINLSSESLDEDTERAAPSYGRQQPDNDAALRLEEIRKREAALADRERSVGQREARIRHGKNNWPFFYPLIFHEIATEIPSESQNVVLTLYRLWLLLVVTLIVNMVACIFLLIGDVSGGGADLGASIMYVPVITVTSFLLWYRPIYNAFMKEHALFYYLFFCFGGFHIAFSTYMTVGIPSTGSAGLINTIRAFGRGSIVTGVLGVISSVGWGLGTLGLLYEYRLIWAHKNVKGHTFEQAQNEVASRGIKAYMTRGSQV